MVESDKPKWGRNLYFIGVVIAFISFTSGISFIMPGIRRRDVLPYQIFSGVLCLFYMILPTNKHIIKN